VGITAGQVEKGFQYLAGKLYAVDRIRARYSMHDLRHAFAVRAYQVTNGVYAVKKALGLASVAVTERYLSSLDVLDAENPR
jgi:integrase